MECIGQLRFGPAGEGAASTLALVLPCAEMVRDDRPDDTVDVAVGTAFGDVNPVRAARDALDQLSGPSAGTGDTDAGRRPATPTGRPGGAGRGPQPDLLTGAGPAAQTSAAPCRRRARSARGDARSARPARRPGPSPSSRRRAVPVGPGTRTTAPASVAMSAAAAQSHQLQPCSR